MLSGCLARLLRARASCILGGLLGRRRLRLLAALQDLQSELEGHDPLLLVIWTQFVGVSGDLLGTVPLQIASKLGYLRLKLLVRLLQEDYIVAVRRTVGSTNISCRSSIALLALAVASSSAGIVVCSSGRWTRGRLLHIGVVCAFLFFRRLPLLAAFALPLGILLLQLVCLVLRGARAL